MADDKTVHEKYEELRADVDRIFKHVGLEKNPVKKTEGGDNSSEA